MADFSLRYGDAIHVGRIEVRIVGPRLPEYGMVFAEFHGPGLTSGPLRQPEPEVNILALLEAEDVTVERSGVVVYSVDERRKAA